MWYFFFFLSITIQSFSFLLLLNSTTSLKPSLHFSLLLLYMPSSSCLTVFNIPSNIVFRPQNRLNPKGPLLGHLFMSSLLCGVTSFNLFGAKPSPIDEYLFHSDSLTSFGSLFHCLSVFIVSKFFIIFNLHFPCNSSSILLCLGWLMRIISLVPLHICRELSCFS